MNITIHLAEWFIYEEGRLTDIVVIYDKNNTLYLKCK